VKMPRKDDLEEVNLKFSRYKKQQKRKKAKINFKAIDKIVDYVSGNLSKKEMKEVDKRAKKLAKEQGWKEAKNG